MLLPYLQAAAAVTAAPGAGAGISPPAAPSTALTKSDTQEHVLTRLTYSTVSESEAAELPLPQAISTAAAAQTGTPPTAHGRSGTGAGAADMSVANAAQTALQAASNDWSSTVPAEPSSGAGSRSQPQSIQPIAIALTPVKLSCNGLLLMRLHGGHTTFLCFVGIFWPLDFQLTVLAL